MIHVPFCTCDDLSCPLNPQNQDQGCTPCIAKNLKLGEIPSCFFNQVKGTEQRTSFFYEDFARAVLKAKEEEEHAI